MGCFSKWLLLLSSESQVCLENVNTLNLGADLSLTRQHIKCSVYCEIVVDFCIR